MHPERIDTTSPDGARPDHGAARDAASAKVLGLGAPISVRIRFDPLEIRLVRNQLVAQLAEHDRSAHDHDSSVTDADDWRARRDTLDAALRGLDTESDAGVEVLWPTVIAHKLLHAALDDALARVPRASIDRASLPALGDALDAARACLQTWMAFTAVDCGGPEDVWL